MSDDKSKPEFYAQDSGFGLSYSLSKTYATFVISAKFSPEYLRRYASLNEAEIRKVQTVQLSKCNWFEMLVNKATQLNLRPVIARYQINKTDVIAFLANEEEEIISISKPRLLRYEAITYPDAFAASELCKLRNSIQAVIIENLPTQSKSNPYLFLHNTREQYFLKKFKNDYHELSKDPVFRKQEITRHPDFCDAEFDTKMNDKWEKNHAEIAQNLNLYLTF